jgi:hemerythrin-like domain-containing protein
MDNLTREALEHKNVTESFTIFRKTIGFFSRPDIEGFKKFLDDNIIDHFKFEENQLFSVISEKGTAEEKALVRELNAQHVQISGMIRDFGKLFFQCGAHPSEDQKDELVKLSSKIIDTLLEHAQREDSKLFPILKKYEVDLT